LDTPQSPANSSYAGTQRPGSGNDPLNAQAFLIEQMLNRAWTATLVKVMAVTNAGGVSPVGFVDILPLVAQIDGAGHATPHGTIFHIPYFRMQGGANAIILDPQVGDLGIAVFAAQDISSVKATKAAANPGSRRKFDPADAIYIGGVLNDVPTQYVAFSASGIAIVSAANVSIAAAAGTVTVTSSHVNLISADVNLGATGGKKVVLDGDPVVAGAVVASSTKVKAV
jgi:hypothetical protein